MSGSVCLSVCLSVCSHISKTSSPNFTKFSERIVRSRGSVFLWRKWNTLCTSGFVDDIIIPIMGPMACERRTGASSHIFPSYSPGGVNCLTLSSTQWQQTAHGGRSLLSTIALLVLRSVTLKSLPLACSWRMTNCRSVSVPCSSSWRLHIAVLLSHALPSNSFKQCD